MIDVIPPFRSAVPISEMHGEDEIDDKLLHEMAYAALRYIRTFPWCIEAHEQYLGQGYGGIVALFLVRITIRKAPEPEWVWLIVGDIPSCYLEFDGFPTPRAALERYIDGVEDWISTPDAERPSRQDLPPICVPSGDEYVDLLRKKITALKDMILPHLADK